MIVWVTRFERVPLVDKIAIAIGTLFGPLVALLITYPLTSPDVVQEYRFPIQLFATVVGVVVGVAFAISAKEQISYVFPALQRAPSGTAGMIRRGRSKLLDTNIIIDGRLCSIVATGFISGPIYVPDFVLQELHHIADSEDSLKRARGRRGLDILNTLNSMDNGEVVVLDDYTEEEAPRDEVDVRLVKLAQARDADVLTNDYGVAEIAKLHGVRVLNVNELASSLKPVYLPGERFSVALIKEGKEQDQAVGYLDDGTMVVVKRASQLIGSNVVVEVETVLQTSAGKMIFATLPDNGPSKTTDGG
jgi:uncharacterized protein YacL